MRRTACKTPESIHRFKKILNSYVKSQTSHTDGAHPVGDSCDGLKTPSWYHDANAANAQPPRNFAPPKNRKGDAISTPHHDSGVPAQGPVGLLIASIIWHGLKIDDDFKIWGEA